MDEIYTLPASLELRLNDGYCNKLLDFNVRAKGKRPTEVEGAKYDHDVLMGDVAAGIIYAFVDQINKNKGKLAPYALELLKEAQRRIQN